MKRHDEAWDRDREAPRDAPAGDEGSALTDDGPPEDLTDEELWGDAGPPAPVTWLDRWARLRPPSSPTLIDELVLARETLTLGEQVSLAIRAGRSSAGMSQRAWARSTSIPRHLVEALEAHADHVRLGAIVAALRMAGYDLALVRCAHAGQGAGVPVEAEAWSAAELLARDHAGRRLPAHVDPSRTDWPRHWLPAHDPRWRHEVAMWTWRQRRPGSAGDEDGREAGVGA